MYLSRLIDYYYTIQYRSGKANRAIDALSRITKNSPSTFLMLLMTHFAFSDQLKSELFTHPKLIVLRQDIQDNPAGHSDYTLSYGLILHKGRIWLPDGLNFIRSLLVEFHTSPTGGHMGIKKTMAWLGDNFIWPSIREDVRWFIAACIDYQHTKYKAWKPIRLLTPLPVPSRPWEDLSLDFSVDLPTYRGHTTILIVVDRFSKGVKLGMLQSNYTTHVVSLLFMDIVGKHHGMPHNLVLDRDPLFINKFWQELFKLSGTRLRMSSAYHPQSDSQMEVLNHIIEQYLRAFVHSKPSTWEKFLIWAEWSYNRSIHSGTGISPFEVTFRKKPPSFPQYLSGTSKIAAIDALLVDWEVVFANLKKKLLKS